MLQSSNSYVFISIDEQLQARLLRQSLSLELLDYDLPSKQERGRRTAPDDTLQGGDTRGKSIRSDSDDQIRSSVFQEKINRGDTAERATKKVARFFRKNRGVTPSVAAPGVTHPSDATVRVNTL